MRYILIIICLSSLIVVLYALFSQRQQTTMNEIKHQNPNLTERDVLFENYLEESRTLQEEFIPLRNRLSEEAFVVFDDGHKIMDFVRWEKEYYQPLFEKSKQAMKRFSGTDDYLLLWENKIPQKLLAKNKEHDEIRASSFYNDLPLLTLYTLAIANERRGEILRDTVYEDSEKGAEIRELGSVSPIANPWAGSMMRFCDHNKDVREMYERMGIWYDFPPRGNIWPIFEPSWYIMVIYSFKNERSRNVLYDIVIHSEEKYDSFADWAVYYLTLSPGSEEFLPKVKTLLKEKIVTFQKEEPELSQTFFNEKGELLDRSMDKLRRIPRARSEYKKETTYRLLKNIRRLLILKRSLEFNEKVPENERKRFEIVRRELAISWALARKYDRGAPRTTAGLKKGEEHFEIYAAEYEIPVYGIQSFYWVENGESSIYTQENYGQKLKDFYVKELVNPRSIYTDIQKK